MRVVPERMIFVCLRPSSDDFTEQRRGYFHWQPHRQALIRLCLALHWTWPTMLFSQILHNIVAIPFVAVIPIDHSNDWPPLYGGPRQVYSLRRSWHKIAAPSQAVYGRVVSRRDLVWKRGFQPKSTLSCSGSSRFRGSVMPS
jgi:hypothetical protein